MKYFKPILFLFVLILSLLTVLSAQVKVGFKIGRNHTNIATSTNINSAYKYNFVPIVTWHIGVVSNFKISDKLSIQPEILFTQKGGQNPLVLDPLAFNEDNYKHKFSYVSIPVLIEYKLGSFSMEAGPEMGFLVNDKILINGVETYFSYTVFDNKFDLSLDIGLKYRNGHFFSQIRWQRSVIPIGDFSFTDVNGEPFINVSYYPTALQLSLGYQL